MLLPSPHRTDPRRLSAPRSLWGAASRSRLSQRMSRVPQQCFGVPFVALAVRIAHQFKLQAPRCLEIAPSGASRRTVFDEVGLAHDLDTMVPEMLERWVEIIDIERDVVTANVAVAGRRRTLVGRFI